MSVAVQVARFVDRHASNAKLDVLPFASIESAQKYLVSMPLAAFVGEQDPWRQLQHFCRILARHECKLPDVNVEVACTSRWRAIVSLHNHFSRVSRAWEYAGLRLNSGTHRLLFDVLVCVVARHVQGSHAAVHRRIGDPTGHGTLRR